MTLQNQANPTPTIRLLRKPEVLRICGGITFPALSRWMCAGIFPRSRLVGGMTMWKSDEIDAWLRDLPLRSYSDMGSVDAPTAVTPPRPRGRRPKRAINETGVGAGRPAQLTPKPYPTT